MAALGDGVIGVRPWLADDIGLVEEAARDVELVCGTTLPRPFSPAGGIAYIERQWARRRSGEGLSLVITTAGEPVGSVSLMLRRPPVADLGYWLVDRARGRGIGSSAVGLLVEWALGQPGIEAVEAFVQPDNSVSARLLERIGFVACGWRRHAVAGLDAEMRVYRLDAAAGGSAGRSLNTTS